MASIVFMSIIILLSANYTSQNNDEEINVGASTSRVLTQYEICEIESYGTDVSRLLLAEDVSGGNLTDMMNHRFHELQVFHDQIYSFYVLAEYGARLERDERFRNRRLEFFHKILQRQLSQILGLACFRHLNFKLWYEYDNRTDKIVGGEKIILGVRHDDCLCHNYNERLLLSKPFNLPPLQRPETTFQISRDNIRLTVMKVSQYHVIPVALISRFFQVWLPDTFGNSPDINFVNGCLVVLIGRLRRSIQKLLIVQIKNSQAFPHNELYEISSDLDSDVDSNFFSLLLSRSNSWLRGNMFLGPTNRGPFNPEFGVYNEDLLKAFERDARYIIGRKRFKSLVSLYKSLLKFVNMDLRMNQLDRLTIGFDLFNWMMVLLVRHDVTHMRIEQWEERKPTSEELRNVEPDELREFLETQKYWAIRKPRSRRPRSENYYNYQVSEGSVTVIELEQIWSNFIMNLTRISINAQSQNKTLNWLCNFTRLYDDYLLYKSESENSDNLNCIISFDKYLLAKINSTSDWSLCNSATNSTPATEWCQAWKRVITQFTLGIEITYSENSENYNNSKSLPETYLNDVVIIMQWLSIQLKSKECKEKETAIINLSNYIIPHEKLHQLRVGTSNYLIDLVLCLSSTFSINECYKIFGKPKKY